MMSVIIRMWRPQGRVLRVLENLPLHFVPNADTKLWRYGVCEVVAPAGENANPAGAWMEKSGPCIDIANIAGKRISS